MNAVTGHFTHLPRSGDEPPQRSPADSIPTVDQPTRIVGLGAICDLGRASKDGRSQAFKISEFALLIDGRRVILHSERGYAIGWGSNIEPPDNLADYDTRESVTQQVLNTVLPDDEDSPDEHPWEWLAELARARGLRVSAGDLRRLPYEVILDGSVTAWLDSADPRDH